MSNPCLTDESGGRLLRFVTRTLRSIRPNDATTSLGLANDAAMLNLVADIPWNIRERVRTIEGLADRIDDELVEILDRMDTDAARNLIYVTWPTND